MTAPWLSAVGTVYGVYLGGTTGAPAGPPGMLLGAAAGKFLGGALGTAAAASVWLGLRLGEDMATGLERSHPGCGVTDSCPNSWGGKR